MEMKIEKTARIVSKDADDDLEDWLKKTPEERLSMVQILREQYMYLFQDKIKEENPDADRKGLQRVYRIVKRSSLDQEE